VIVLATFQKFGHFFFYSFDLPGGIQRLQNELRCRYFSIFACKLFWLLF